jgi:hypothetical protein
MLQAAYAEVRSNKKPNLLTIFLMKIFGTSIKIYHAKNTIANLMYALFNR